MKREEYFEFLKETSELTSPVIQRYTETFLDINKDLYDVLMFFIQKRLNKPLLKPALLRLSYEICGGQDWEKVIPAAVAFEFINISSYQANSVFDNKLNVITKPQKDSQFIASMVTRELASKVASELKKDFDEHIVNEIYVSLSKCNEYIYLAQHYDLNVLNVKNYETYVDEQLFQDEYIKRCFYGSGIFNGQCAYVGGLLAKANPGQLEALREFGENFGTALQMVNDIGDFIPSGTDKLINRSFQDQYSDFKNGRLTLPLYHLLKLGNLDKGKRIKNIMDKKLFDGQTLLDVTNILIEEGSISYAKEKAKEFIKLGKKQLRIFEEIKSKRLLHVMATIILTNKYFSAFKKLPKLQIKT